MNDPISHTHTISLERAVALFVAEFKPSTRKSYHYTLRELISHVGGARPLTDVRAEHLLEHMQYVRARPTVRSPATINKHVKALRTFFNWCARNGWISAPTPAAALRFVPIPDGVDKSKAMPDAVYAALCDYAKWDIRAYALVLFLGDTGCRIGGAASLRWSNTDLVHRVATVTEKGDLTRKVFFGPLTATALARWQIAQKALDGDYTFSADGHRMTSDSLGQYFSRTAARAGLGTWGPHSLRHRKGYQLSDSNISPTVSARALGHANYHTTLSSYYPRDYGRAQAALEALHMQPQAAEPPPSASRIIVFRGKSDAK